MEINNQSITLTAPDDFHCHFRDDAYLKRTVNDTALRFQRAIIMPNLTPAITTVALATQYRQRILAHIPANSSFIPLMTLYLTEETDFNTLKAAKASPFIVGCKLYPAGATTHSDAGVKKIENIYPLLEAMEALDLPLLIHGEVVDSEVDFFAREAVFIEKILTPISQRFNHLRIVLEHISTRLAVDFVKASSKKIAATITPQHLLYHRNIIFAGGLKPHYYCLPILKTADDQKALIEAAISGNPKFFLGTDSAPHARSQKESACGCAGLYSAHAGIELYAEIFTNYNALDQLENFASIYGAEFYQLPINSSKITLARKPWQVPLELSFGDTTLVPLFAGETLQWKLVDLSG